GGRHHRRRRRLRRRLPARPHPPLAAGAEPGPGQRLRGMVGQPHRQLDLRAHAARRLHRAAGGPARATTTPPPRCRRDGRAAMRKEAVMVGSPVRSRASGPRAPSRSPLRTAAVLLLFAVLVSGCLPAADEPEDSAADDTATDATADDATDAASDEAAGGETLVVWDQWARGVEGDVVDQLNA